MEKEGEKEERSNTRTQASKPSAKRFANGKVVHLEWDSPNRSSVTFVVSPKVTQIGILQNRLTTIFKKNLQPDLQPFFVIFGKLTTFGIPQNLTYNKNGCNFTTGGGTCRMYFRLPYTIQTKKVPQMGKMDQICIIKTKYTQFKTC